MQIYDNNSNNANKYSQARQFDAKMYTNTDNLAKEMFKPFITNRGHIITKEDEDYKHDLQTEKDGEVFLFELEISLANVFSSKEDYKYEKVSFLGRKERLHDIEPFYYVIICKATRTALVAHSSDIYCGDNYIERYVNTPNREGLDRFYVVDKDKVKFFKI